MDKETFYYLVKTNSKLYDYLNKITNKEYITDIFYNEFFLLKNKDIKSIAKKGHQLNNNIDESLLLRIYSLMRSLIIDNLKYIVDRNNCKHENIVAKFMGGGFLHVCEDCGEPIYGI